MYIIAMVDERAREGEEERQGGRPVVEAEGGRSGEGSERQSTAGRHHGKVVLRRARTLLLPPPPTIVSHAILSPMATGNWRLPHYTCDRALGAVRLYCAAHSASLCHDIL